MENYLPKGANFIRAKFLWEIGLHIAGNPATPYYGNRDICVTVGSGSGEKYKPWLRMSCGSPILAHAVARGELEAAIVNPSAMLTQAVRGKGLFSAPLPLCIVANYPSWDRFAFIVHPKAGVSSLADIKAKRMPLRISTREDATHSTRDFINQVLGIYGFSLKDVEGWGGSLQLNGGPGDKRRLQAIRVGAVVSGARLQCLVSLGPGASSISENSEQRAILFADVCESTSIYEKLGDAKALALINTLFKALDKEVNGNGGVIVKTLGDGMVCEFREPDAAFRAACGMQEATGRVDAKDKGGLKIKVGYTYGPVVLKDRDVFGDTVNVCARLVSLANAQQVLTTRETVNSLSDELRS